jgi:hypothetical protein
VDQSTFAAPRHALFAPGDTIAAEGSGIFFLDPVTGAAEGWVTPNDQGCVAGAVQAEGRKVFYTCRRQQQPSPPGGAPALTTYVLDTVSGGWSPFTAPDDSYGIIAPDGGALTQLAIGAVRSVVARSPGVSPALERWAPDGSAFVAGFRVAGDQTSPSALYLIRMDSSEPIALPGGLDWPAWAPDGTKIALVESMRGEKPRTTDAITVVDSRGRTMWSRDAVIYGGNPRWSPDSRLLGLQVRRGLPSQEEPNPVDDLSVFDGASGEPAFRVLGALACAGQYWTADNRLIAGSYVDAGDIVIDPEARTLHKLGSYVTPSPTDSRLGISLDSGDFYAVDLQDASRRLIAKTTVDPAWDFAHEPLFAGGRIVFRAPHGGHGGCGEGSPPLHLPVMELQFPPYLEP